jgi:hypothetical protein
MAILENTSITGTDALKLPSGTTAERPISPSFGMIRHNTSFNTIETWNGSRWIYSPYIETSGLALCLDAGEPASYPGTGTTWSTLYGSGGNATLVNSPTYSSNNGGYFTFNGTNQYAVISAATVYNTAIRTRLTAEAWIYPTSSSQLGYIISEQFTGAGNEVNFAMLLTDGNGITTGGLIPTWGYYDGTTWTGNLVFSKVPLVLNTWNQIVGVHNGVTVYMYVNGVRTESAVKSNTAGAWVSGTAAEVYIGKRWDNAGTNAYFSGRIAAVYLYKNNPINDFLYQDQVRRNYQALRKRFSLP